MTYTNFLKNEFEKYLVKRDELERDFIKGDMSINEYNARIDEILKEAGKVFY